MFKFSKLHHEQNLHVLSSTLSLAWPKSSISSSNANLRLIKNMQRCARSWWDVDKRGWPPRTCLPPTLSTTDPVYQGPYLPLNLSTTNPVYHWPWLPLTLTTSDFVILIFCRAISQCFHAGGDLNNSVEDDQNCHVFMLMMIMNRSTIIITIRMMRSNIMTIMM